ncbi:hypothetical protein Tco_1487237, partial [Tanacetum coccineum]
TWRLYDSCGVHHVSIEKGINIYMLVEKEYPLSRGTLTLMLVTKLLMDQDNEMSRELLRKIFVQVNHKLRGGLLGIKGFLTVTTAGLSYNCWLELLLLLKIEEKVLKNGNSFKPAAPTTKNADGTSTSLIPGPVTTEEKAQKKNMLQKIVSQLAILGENISQEDLNLKFFRSLPSNWNTHVVVWRNKPDLDTMSFDDLYNNFKIVEEQVKGTASSNSSSQNMAFVSSSSSTNEVNTAYVVSTANTQVIPASTQVSTASTQVSTDNLSDATVYAFMAN